MDDKLLETTEGNLGSDEDMLQDDVGDDAADRPDDVQKNRTNYLTQEDFDRVLRRARPVGAQVRPQAWV